MELGKYSFGIGDRFGCQGKAQLEAIRMASKQGIEIIPVWNKSFREHSLVHTIPADTRNEADKAVKNLNSDRKLLSASKEHMLSSLAATSPLGRRLGQGS